MRSAAARAEMRAPRHTGAAVGFLLRVLVNALVLLTLPVTLVTLGLFLLVLNGLCLWLTSQLVKGFEVHGFWEAVLGALLVSVVSWILNAFVSDRGRIVVITGRVPGRRA